MGFLPIDTNAHKNPWWTHRFACWSWVPMTTQKVQVKYHAAELWSWKTLEYVEEHENSVPTPCMVSGVGRLGLRLARQPPLCRHQLTYWGCRRRTIGIEQVSPRWFPSFITWTSHEDILAWMVVWNMNFMLIHSVGNVIIPTDFQLHTFFRWVGHTTNQLSFFRLPCLHIEPQFAVSHHAVPWPSSMWGTPMDNMEVGTSFSRASHT